MYIHEALELSKATGAAFHCRNRSSPWIKYQDDWVYKLSYDQLTADDWEPLGAEGRRLVSEYRKSQAPNITIGKDGLCECDCGTKCPLGKMGLDYRCRREELEAAGIAIQSRRPRN